MTNWLSSNPFKNPLPPEIEELSGKHPRKYTKKEARAVADFYADTLSMKELRKRQDITNQQIALAVQQKNEEVFENQRMMEEIITEAIDKKAFG